MESATRILNVVGFPKVSLQGNATRLGANALVCLRLVLSGTDSKVFGLE
jgi:hypothetical protein